MFFLFEEWGHHYNAACVLEIPWKLFFSSIKTRPRHSTLKTRQPSGNVASVVSPLHEGHGEVCAHVTESSDITRQHFHPNCNFPLHSHAVYEPWLEAPRHFPPLPAFLSLRRTCKNWRSCVRLRVCSCAPHCDDLWSLRKNFNHLCSSLALVMQQLVYTAYTVIYPPPGNEKCEY